MPNESCEIATAVSTRSLPANRVTGSLIEDLKKVLLEHSGPVPVFLHLGQKVLRLPDHFNVATDKAAPAGSVPPHGTTVPSPPNQRPDHDPNPGTDRQG